MARLGPEAEEVSRRGFLHAAALAGAAGMGWLPSVRLRPTSPRASLPSPPQFPDGIALYQQAYQNWSGEICIPDVWTAAPRSPEELVAIANWAHGQGWRVRPKGRSHGWSPLLLPGEASGAGCLLVDTTQYLTRVAIDRDGVPATVTAQTGVAMEVLLDALGAAGLGFTATPAIGDATLGGVLAVDGHGTAVPACGEQPLAGKGYGSLCNAVLALTAVVWDGRGQYRLRSFRRDDPGIQPLLTHAGRACITEATLQVGADVDLRCRSFFDIAASELFAPPAQAGPNSFQAWVEACGRVEAIWFPFTAVPWLKVWSPARDRPWMSRTISAPYAYCFANWVTPAQARFIGRLVSGSVADTPIFQNLEMAAVGAGLVLTGTWDLWGPSRFSTLYVKPTTLRLAENGYAVLTGRDRIQRVVSDYCAAYRELIARYQARGEFPMNGPLEIRVTGLNRADEVMLPGALEPQLSALRPRPDHPSWDCAVWIDALTFPGTPGENRFKTELEAWVLGNYTGDYAGVRVEWAKGWGYTEAGAWTSAEVLEHTLPGSLTAGQRRGDGWEAAMAALDRYDPGRIFSNPFLDRVLKSP
ncbi:MAG: cholesterol oxidase substrate-binding domain-containing protein [Holophaga sp.]|nr:cholesterol oxidase substrate-binding domain-containing protein [Holophaga sp.]